MGTPNRNNQTRSIYLDIGYTQQNQCGRLIQCLYALDVIPVKILLLFLTFIGDPMCISPLMNNITIYIIKACRQKEVIISVYIYIYMYEVKELWKVKKKCLIWDKSTKEESYGNDKIWVASHAALLPCFNSRNFPESSGFRYIFSYSIPFFIF